MARNRPTGGRQGAIRGRLQFRLPNGHYAKVDRTTGRILSVKADRKPYKGIVITTAPARLPRRAGERPILPRLVARASRQPRATATPALQVVTLPEPEIRPTEDLPLSA